MDRDPLSAFSRVPRICSRVVFPAPLAPDDAHDLALGHLQVNSLQDLQVPVFLADGSGVDHGVQRKEAPSDAFRVGHAMGERVGYGPDRYPVSQYPSLNFYIRHRHRP
jgi:hypothetical protein